MASQIIVSTRELNSKSQALQSSNTQLNRMIDQLQQQELSLCSMWEGDAKDEFDKEFRKDIQQMKNFYEAIKNYILKLNEIIKNYDQAEAKNVQIAKERKYR